MDTDGIRLFVRAADHLNISAAGRELGLSPAVAGAKLAKLEKQLGTELLHRSTRKISLSLDGAEFLPFARDMLAQEAGALAALGQGQDQGDIQGTIRFSASSTFAQLYIAPILPEFFARFPKINLDARFSDTQTDLIEGGFDLALRNFAIEDSSLKARKLADDKRILCAAPAYVDAFGAPIRPEQLVEHQLILFRGAKQRSLSSQDQKGVAPFPPPQSSCRMICDDGASMKIATLAAGGISMNSLWSVQRELMAGSLVRILPDYEVKDQAAIWLVYPKSHILTAKVRVFIDFLLEKIGTPPVWETDMNPPF